MKIWERRLMKDFQVACVEVQESSEDAPEEPHVEENPLDRFRRIGKLVASQSTTVKWSEVILGATIEANSQIGRCKNRESFKNQQNLLKAMDQAKRLIDRSPMPQSPAHSETYSIVNQTNETLLKLLQNISEEINNEISPSNTLRVKAPNQRSVTPLHSLNAQLQSVINSRNPSPYSTKEKSRATTPRPPILNLKKPEAPKEERILSPPPKPEIIDIPKSPRGSISKGTPRPKSPSKFELSKSPLSRPPASILKNRSATPESSKSLDDVKSGGVDEDCKVIAESVTQSKPSAIVSMPSIEISSSENDTPIHSTPQSPTLIDLHCANSNEKAPVPQVSGSPIKVVKRKAPIATDQSQQDISILRPVAAKNTSAQGMIPPPPSRNEEVKAPLQIPILSTTPATPLPTQKQVTENLSIPESPIPAISSSQIFSSTEALVKPNEPAPSCLRPVQKIEDVKTIKRQMKTGWL